MTQLEQDMQQRMRVGDFQIVPVATISMFHALLASAPLGFLGGSGKPHVKGCNCRPCRSRKTRARKLGIFAD
jgi:hypothetical protein